MAPLINDNDYMVVDIDGTDLFSSDIIKQQSAPLHVTPQTSSKPRRQVSFFGTVTCHTVMNREGYTAEETKATWYDRSSLRQIKESARSEARLVESGVLAESDDISIRGLEGKTTYGVRQKRANRMNAYAAVFLEIDTQLDFGYVDEEAIADVYFSYSEPCLVAAQMLAVRDAEEAKNTMQSMELAHLFG
jgi:hypothetical protein